MVNGERVLAARQMRGLSERDASARLGLTRQQLADLEDGLLQPSRDLMAALCVVLQFPASFFRQGSLPDWPHMAWHQRATPGPWSRYERPPVRRRPALPHTHCDGCDDELWPLDGAATSGYCVLCRSKGVTRRRTPAAMAAYAAEADHERRAGWSS